MASRPARSRSASTARSSRCSEPAVDPRRRCAADFAALAAICDAFFPRIFIRCRKPAPIGTVTLLPRRCPAGAGVATCSARRVRFNFPAISTRAPRSGATTASCWPARTRWSSATEARPSSRKTSRSSLSGSSSARRGWPWSVMPYSPDDLFRLRSITTMRLRRSSTTITSPVSGSSRASEGGRAPRAFAPRNTPGGLAGGGVEDHHAAGLAEIGHDHPLAVGGGEGVGG